MPFFIVPKLDWLFWSWFKAFIQYSFIPVVAFAFLMVFERFVFQFLTTLPPGITEDLYMVYGLQALVIIGVFVVGILLVPSLTSSIFSGRGGESVLPDRITCVTVIGGMPMPSITCANAQRNDRVDAIHAVLSDRVRDCRPDRPGRLASSGSIAGLLHFHPLW